MSRRNCKRCTRWRPLIDYQPVLHKPTMTEYLRNICESCIKVKRRARHRARTFAHKIYDREYKRQQRRAEGIPVRVIGPKNRGMGGYGGYWSAL